MNDHRFIRAYLAGVFIPTLVFPLVITALAVGRHLVQAPFQLERIIIFPLAFVPILWGLWNVLWAASRGCTHLPLGVHGAILPFLLMPAGAALAQCLGVIAFGATHVIWFQVFSIPYAVVACGFAFALVAYYLVWKYVVGFVNGELGID